MLYDSFLIIISGYQWWDLSWHTVFIQGNENKIAAGDFAYFAGYRVLGGNLDTNFHACATGIMDFTVHRDDISDECRCKEIKAFYTYCNRGRWLCLIATIVAVSSTIRITIPPCTFPILLASPISIRRPVVVREWAMLCPCVRSTSGRLRNLLAKRSNGFMFFFKLPCTQDYIYT